MRAVAEARQRRLAEPGAQRAAVLEQTDRRERVCRPILGLVELQETLARDRGRRQLRGQQGRACERQCSLRVVVWIRIGAVGAVAVTEQDLHVVAVREAPAQIRAGERLVDGKPGESAERALRRDRTEHVLVGATIPAAEAAHVARAVSGDGEQLGCSTASVAGAGARDRAVGQGCRQAVRSIGRAPLRARRTLCLCG